MDIELSFINDFQIHYYYESEYESEYGSESDSESDSDYVQKQLSKNGWKLPFSSDTVYVVLTCSTLNLKWNSAISFKEYDYYQNIDDWHSFITIQLNDLYSIWIDFHNTKSYVPFKISKNKQFGFLDQISLFDFIRKNNSKIQTLLKSYEFNENGKSFLEFNTSYSEYIIYNS